MIYDNLMALLDFKIKDKKTRNVLKSAQSTTKWIFFIRYLQKKFQFLYPDDFYRDKATDNYYLQILNFH